MFSRVESVTESFPYTSGHGLFHSKTVSGGTFVEGPTEK